MKNLIERVEEIIRQNQTNQDYARCANCGDTWLNHSYHGNWCLYFGFPGREPKTKFKEMNHARLQ